MGDVGAERAQRLFSSSGLSPKARFKVPSSRFKVIAGGEVQSWPPRRRSRFQVQDSRLSPEARFKIENSKFKVAAGKNLQLKGFSSLNFLHHATGQAVFYPANGDNADISHFFFFFIVCWNLKTAKLSSIVAFLYPVSIIMGTKQNELDDHVDLFLDQFLDRGVLFDGLQESGLKPGFHQSSKTSSYECHCAVPVRSLA